MKDREIIDALVAECIERGDDVLETLESNGYVVIRAGLVPKFDDLDSTIRLLSVLGDVNGQIHDPKKSREAANQLAWLRELAMLVLRIDPDAMEDSVG